MKSKITNLKEELEELEKLSCNTDQLQKLVNTGLLGNPENCTKSQLLGKVHTQIVIDAEQSLTENVIKVNSIHRKFIGYEPLPAADKTSIPNLSALADL